jgi:hypothetical protein
MQQIEAVFSHIKDEDLTKLASQLAIDKCNSKILGSLMFKGLMRLILSGKKASLRMLEVIISQDLDVSVTYSGLSKRLRTLNPSYFKTIYENLINSCSPEFQKIGQKDLHRFDSTVIALVGRLIKDGLKAGGKDSDSHIKVTFGLKNELPTSMRFCTEKSELGEDVALVKAINEAKVEKEDVLLFDRGIANVQSFKKFCQQEYKFVTRTKDGRKHKFIRQHQPSNEIINGNHFLEDSIVHLYGKTTGAKSTKKPIANDLRLIKMINHQGNEIWFLTNLFDSSAAEIADMYKRRWDIETFFKFLKQNLGYKHFLSHSLNGMQVYLYMVLITAVLFLLYKKRKNLSGFKLALFEFTRKVEKSYVKDLIILCGGNPDAEAVKYYFK